ncbi:hypothetical protein SLS53_003097 [Cytospora paraplurivora]|uniref:C3H1-type domain-containing protein n=1 Tax=Cytospora paraplurivora TaxID=2898453 RepID=A0AAN9UAT1_9PEZI
MQEEEVEETITPKDPIPAAGQTTRLPTHTGTTRNSLSTKLSPMVLSIQDSTLPSMYNLDLPPQQWPAQAHDQHQQHPQAHNPLPAQNYHPNYAQHLYTQQQQQQQQQQPYAPHQQQQPAYVAPPQQPYGQPYPPPQQPSGPPQQWGAPAPSHSPQSQPSQQHFGAGRGRGGHHNAPRAQPMGPPIRMGFDNGPPRDPTAPVSTSYPPQPYGPPQGPSPYPPAPYQGYPPPPAPPVPAGPPQHYEGHLQQNGRHHGRGGFNNNNNFRHRTGFNDNKGRHHNHSNNSSSNSNNTTRKPGGPPSTPQTHHQKPDAASTGKKKKRKTNTLGLTPGDESEDDFDEEAKLSELIGADAPEPSDIAAWIAERKRNFPTQNRVKAKLAAGADRKSSTSKNGDAKDERTLALEKEQAKADKLRRELEKVESSLKRKREQQDAGDEMRDIVASSTVSPSAKSGDEKPEAMSSKPDPNANLPPPPKKADPTKHCKYYSTGGTCGKKGKCRFVHDPAVREAALKEREMNGGRMTLQQRLALNDKDQEDLTIIKTLAYLKEKGLMEAKAASNGASVNGHGSTKSTKSSLPPPPASGLPPQPPPSVVSTPTVRYQGWNLSGFGNTGVKSEH